MNNIAAGMPHLVIAAGMPAAVRRINVEGQIALNLIAID